MNSTGIQFSFQSEKRAALFYLPCVMIGILLANACGRKALTNQENTHHISESGVAAEMRDHTDRSRGKDLAQTQQQSAVITTTPKNIGTIQEIGAGKNGGNNNLFNRGF